VPPSIGLSPAAFRTAPAWRLNLEDDPEVPRDFDVRQAMGHYNIRRNLLVAVAVGGVVAAATFVSSKGTPLGSVVIGAAQSQNGTATVFTATPNSGAAPLLVNFRASPAVLA
jgi:hypothetical protein